MSYAEKPNFENIPRLSMGLERALFNRGVMVLQDPRTGVFNFDPALKRIPRPEEFDFSLLSPFVPPSQDKTLQDHAKNVGARYTASTSSAGSLLAQFLMTVTDHREVDTSGMSMAFLGESRRHSRIIRLPCSALLHWLPEQGGYALDAEKPADEEARETVLSKLGKVLEKKLTLKPEAFERYLLNASGAKPQPEIDSFHYGKFGNFLLRSQLDCVHPSLPKLTFDLKTRATQIIRMDPHNYHDKLGYKLHEQRGAYQSYEREFYDMLRSAALKWSLQARIGCMDGVFVYLPLETMDDLLFGGSEIAEQAFHASLRMLELILEKATTQFPQQSLRLTLKTQKKVFPNPQFLSVYVQPVVKGQLDDPDTLQQPVVKYRLECYSTINGERTLRRVSSGGSVACRFEVYWKVADVTARANAADLWREYESVRKDCSNLKDDILSEAELKRKENFMSLLRKR
ncbi:hypothetical protein HDU93_009821 [Gonapodya sp. JEL0774]|nr:hypothetical protein HDU93_009821 [Gonapodya sp. JEL0774]